METNPNRQTMIATEKRRKEAVGTRATAINPTTATMMPRKQPLKQSMRYLKKRSKSLEMKNSSSRYFLEFLNKIIKTTFIFNFLNSTFFLFLMKHLNPQFPSVSKKPIIYRKIRNWVFMFSFFNYKFSSFFKYMYIFNNSKKQLSHVSI